MSMRIIDLQRRLREIGRLRIGEKVTTKNGKVRPDKIDVFRFTSRDRQVIDAAAVLWGGTVEEWTDAPGDGTQWQVRTTAQQIPVVVPPGDMSFSQSYEQWTAGGCKVRCDSRWDHIGDQPCHCDPEQRACAIHTRPPDQSHMMANQTGPGRATHPSVRTTLWPTEEAVLHFAAGPPARPTQPSPPDGPMNGDTT
jgi:hypothetical protein